MKSLRRLYAYIAIAFVGCASKPDPRLLGRWRSDEVATVEYIKTNSNLTAEQIKILADIYGKLQITFETRHMYWELDDWQQTTPYEVVSRGPHHCVIRVFNESLGRRQTLRFDFDTDGLWETSDINRKGLEKERFLRVK